MSKRRPDRQGHDQADSLVDAITIDPAIYPDPAAVHALLVDIERHCGVIVVFQGSVWEMKTPRDVLRILEGAVQNYELIIAQNPSMSVPIALTFIKDAVFKLRSLHVKSGPGTTP